MRELFLTKGKIAIVDDEDFEFLNKWKWKYHKDGYAVRNATGNKPIYMHRLVNKTPIGFITDHINRNGLDNRRLNLRTSNFTQNALNSGMWKHNTSGVKGVYWSKQKNKWHARIMINQKHIHLGFFIDINDALKSRIKWERQYCGTI
jgi:hypothetical protein